MNKQITFIVGTVVLFGIIGFSIVAVLRSNSNINNESNSELIYTKSDDNIELTKKETTQNNIVWSAKLTVSSGGHSLRVKEVDEETGLVTLIHRKPGAGCMVTQAFETLEVTFKLKTSVNAHTEVLDTVYEC